MLNSRTPDPRQNQHTSQNRHSEGKQNKNQKRKAKVSRRPGLSSSSPAVLLKISTLVPRVVFLIKNLTSLPAFLVVWAFFFRFSFGVNDL